MQVLGRRRDFLQESREVRVLALHEPDLARRRAAVRAGAG